VRYLLDTNIVSTLVRPIPDPRVDRWFRETPPLDLVISTLLLGEVEQGIGKLPEGRQRQQLLHWGREELPRLFNGRILPVDEAVARCWGGLSAEGRQSGRPLPVVDGLLLATAAVHELVLVSRNVADVAQRGVPVLDPFTGTLHE
jgi:predicted nucleic acid-binding protein